ncbi:DUF4391 domain-containing protein [Streptomyces sp. NPDC127100]|uniref:DUF4391 domain-containing protein n=1 Tax=Streptomyces sp. NPDC127100 TaxID=3347138 RepID=UPI003662E312
MSAATELINALALPIQTHVGQRVPKALLLEATPLVPADRRRLTEGIDELRWAATLKPGTVGIPAYADDVREVLEINVLTLSLRPDARTDRIGELVHRAVPYPVVLLTAQEPGRRFLSLALKRRALAAGGNGRTVVDGEVTEISLHDGPGRAVRDELLAALPLARQPRESLLALYHGWLDVLVAVQASAVTDTFALAGSPERTAARQVALRTYGQVQDRIAALRSRARKERQLAVRAELNTEIQQLREASRDARQEL